MERPPTEAALSERYFICFFEEYNEDIYAGN
jgi:hypothetical protein